MSEKSFILSSSGLKNIISEEKEFKFIIGEKEIIMNSISAEFLSPIVSRIHHSDPTVNSIRLEIPPSIKIGKSKDITLNIISKEVQNLIKEIGEGERITINEKQSYELRNISILLGNHELFSEMNRLFPININETNINENFDEILNQVKFIMNISKENQMLSFLYEEIISSVSSFFYKIDSEKIKKIPRNIFYEIICHEKLKIENEDFLFDIINDLFENSNDDYPRMMDFYEQIDVNNLSEEKFIEFFNKLDQNEISGTLWSKLCHYISKKSINSQTDSSRYIIDSKIHNFLFDGNDQQKLNGIIRFLTNQNGGNVHEKGIVDITSSSQYSNNGRFPKSAVDLDNNQSHFASQNQPNSWLRFDFKKRKVRPTHYSIKSMPCGKGEWHPMNWVIEGSNNGTDWKILDSRNDISILDAKSVIQTFDIQEKLKNNEFYRYLQIRQTGLNARKSVFNNGYVLAFSAIEYFGSISNIDII